MSIKSHDCLSPPIIISFTVSTLCNYSDALRPTMDAALTQRGSEFRSKNPEKLTFGLIEPPGVFSETQDYTEWPFIRP